MRSAALRAHGASERAIEPAERAAPASDGLLLSSARPAVLVADGDPAARTSMARTLHLLGYATVAAADGVEALALADRHAGSLALLVVEVATPGFGSVDLTRALGVLRPRVPVLFVFAERAPRDLGDVVVGRPAPFLVKPPRPKSFAAPSRISPHERT
jgi:CheY-like chemotaxis protein